MGDLEEIGFKLNPYNPCFSNLTINGNQMTICWHVDDLKVSHVDPQEVTKMISWLAKKYKTTFGEVKAARGKVHDYLGMKLNFSEKGSVKLT